jgi:hypothetical protein
MIHSHYLTLENALKASSGRPPYRQPSLSAKLAASLPGVESKVCRCRLMFLNVENLFERPGLRYDTRTIQSVVRFQGRLQEDRALPQGPKKVRSRKIEHRLFYSLLPRIMAPLKKSRIFAALVATFHAISAQSTSWDHSLFTSSPPVYPSREFGAPAFKFTIKLTLYIAPSVGDGWETAFAQADAFVANLTLEEKAALLTGVARGPCIGTNKNALFYRRTAYVT